MTVTTYCLECGERWSLDPDKHQMRCPARARLLQHDARGALAFRGSMDDAPKPSAGARESTRASRAYRCMACDSPWSVYPQNHKRGCKAGRLLARGQREDAKRRWRSRPGELPRPEAAPGLAARFRLRAGGER